MTQGVKALSSEQIREHRERFQRVFSMTLKQKVVRWMARVGLRRHDGRADRTGATRTHSTVGRTGFLSLSTRPFRVPCCSTS